MKFIDTIIWVFMALIGMVYAESVGTDTSEVTEQPDIPEIPNYVPHVPQVQDPEQLEYPEPVTLEQLDISTYTQEIFTVDLIETKKYTVEGHTCTVDMIYFEGSCSGEYFNGELIYKDSSTVVKSFKDGSVEDIARIYIKGTDNNNNAARIHIEDVFLGNDENGRGISRPNIIAEIEELVWLETADVIGIAEKTEKGKRVRYLWSGKNDKPYPVVPKVPKIDAEKFTNKFLTIDVSIPGLGFEYLVGPAAGALKLGFTCSTNTTEFKGVGADYFVDTRYNYPGYPQKISARYIIEGVDDEGNPMKIFVENKGTDDYGDNRNVQTVPFIITDNPKWAWVETAPVHGTHSDVALQIFFWTVEGADQQQQQQQQQPELPEPQPTEVPVVPEQPQPTEVPAVPEQPQQPQQSKQVDTSKYTKEVFAVNLIETHKYSVDGNTCYVEMIYLEGSCAGEYFNGELIFKDSSTVVKRFKDGRIESTARYYVNGTDYENNAGHIHFEDNLLGYDENQRPVTVPTIITDIQNLAWLQTADIIGVMEKTDEGRLVHYMWNESNTTKKPFPVARYPDESKNYNKKVLTVDVIPGGLGFDGFQGVEGTGVAKLGFNCFANTTTFQGEGVDYFVDTRYIFSGQPQSLSARYIMEGVDDEGNKMKIYVQNDGLDDNGDNQNVRTEPLIITDNPKWAWIETAPLHGNMTMEGSIQILFWTVDNAFQQPENPENPEDPEVLELPGEVEETPYMVDITEGIEDEDESSSDEESEQPKQPEVPANPEQPQQPQQPKQVDTSKYTKEVFAVNLIETHKYSVDGNTCFVEMIYLEGSCAGEYFNGELIFKDSSTVVKRFKDGRIESTARYYVNGTDYENNAGHIHFEDNLLGYDENQRPVTVPTIITDIQNLAWLQTADIIGVMEKTDEGRLVHYMWNESNTTKKPFPVARYPDESKNYNKKVLTVDVIPGGLGFDGFQGVEGTGVAKLGFNCFANTTTFQGEGVDYFVDTRYIFSGQPQSLSARYIMEGVDDEGNKMKIYVQNDGLDDNGDNQNVRTEPLIITDNPKWAWIETAPLHGNMTMEGSIQILFWTVDEADLN
ncbi:hypothetical protein PIROE2DRAFT_9839 [Piromyces sp. E2]|nr:hypothetical protein PIROE2DRAFT_9839 [Piromyces sp. E2]|eukprot:OUM63560.1 hypothetical protein PIROE2DRAFT_9839 [Piromyces sp. E2]